MYSKLSKSSIKWKIHRLGLLAAFLCLLISVDPASLHGIYPRNIPPWLSANVTATIISCLVVVKEAAMVVLWRARMKEVPAWLSYESWTMIIILYLTANLSYGVAYWQHKWYWTGIFMMSISIVLIVEACLFAGATYLVIRDLSEAQALTRSSSSSSVRGREQLQKAESQRRTMIMKAVTMLLLAFAVAPLQITSGLNRFHDSKTIVHQPNLDKFEIWDRIFDYAQWTAMAIGLWYSWYVQCGACWCTCGACHACHSYSCPSFELRLADLSCAAITGSRYPPHQITTPQCARRRRLVYCVVSQTVNALATARREDGSTCCASFIGGRFVRHGCSRTLAYTHTHTHTHTHTGRLVNLVLASVNESTQTVWVAASTMPPAELR